MNPYIASRKDSTALSYVVQRTMPGYLPWWGYWGPSTFVAYEAGCVELRPEFTLYADRKASYSDFSSALFPSRILRYRPTYLAYRKELAKLLAVDG